MNFPKQTASGKYNFDTIYNNKPLREWISLINKELCIINNWTYTQLDPGMYGYDNFATSLCYVFMNLDKNLNLLEYADLIHEGWSENYIYWRDNEPYKNNLYKKPFNPIGTEYKNMLATTEFKLLPIDEQKKDIDIAKILLELLNN